MPTPKLISYDKKQRRYRKEYKKQNYDVTCKQLGIPDHVADDPRQRDRNQQIANAWWLAKKLEIDVSGVDYRRQVALDEMQARIEWAQQNEPCLVPELSHKKSQIKVAEINEIQAVKTYDPKNHKGMIQALENPAVGKAVIAAYFSQDQAWKERTKKTSGNTEQDTETLLKQFLKLTSAKQAVGNSKQVKRYLTKLFDLGILPKDATTINKHTVDANHQHLVEQTYTNETKNKHLGFFRRFVRWLYRNEVIEKEPLNLMEKLHRFEVYDK